MTGVLVLAGPWAQRAQAAATIRRIGWLGIGARPSPVVFERRDTAFRELGWIEGQNLLIESRFGSADLLPLLAEELVRLKVELIVTQGTAATLAAKNATATVPIVMWSAGDPVAGPSPAWLDPAAIPASPFYARERR
jgi:putative ABC transport system substrate-binding protein